MKKAVMGAVFIIAAVFVCQEAQAQALSWDLRFLQGQKRESVSISRAVRMETGEEFLIAIKPDTTTV
jgi:hypothetical protein